MRLNRYVVRSTIVGALGGLLFGFDTAVISGATQGVTRAFHLDVAGLGATVSIALWGTVIGSIAAGALGQRFGSREMLRWMAVFYIVSSLGCAAAGNWTMLLAARFIGGLGIGGSSVLGPVYIAELAPARLRGRLVGAFQINIVVGILLAYLSNYLIGLFNLGADEWRWELGVAAAPAAIFLLLLFSIPQSARWLAARGEFEQARRVLETIGSEDSSAELEEICAALHVERGRDESLFVRVGGRLRYGKPIFLAVTIAAFNQLSGINAILYYANDIFAAAGFSHMSGNIQAVAIGAMNLAATLFAMTLIDRVGRRTLLLIGAAGMAVCLSAVAAIFLTQQHRTMLVYTLIAYIAFFAISQGAVIWVYISEIFPTKVRGMGQSLGSGTHWVMNAILSAAFPLIAARSGAYPFIFFAAMMVMQLIIVALFFPETKQASLEQLQKKLILS